MQSFPFPLETAIRNAQRNHSIALYAALRESRPLCFIDGRRES